MANTDNPTGLRPIRHRNGSCIVQNAYSIAAAYATNIYRGDPVELTGTTGQIQLAAAANADNLGVFAGCEYTDASGKRQFSKYWPSDSAATSIVAFVWDDPQIIFEVQVDTIAVTDLGALVDWDAGTPSAATGLSGAFGDVGSGTGTTGKSLRLERLVPRDDNASGAYAKVEVSFYEHALNAAVGAGT